MSDTETKELQAKEKMQVAAPAEATRPVTLISTVACSP